MYQASDNDGVVHSREAWSSSIPCLFWRLDSEVVHRQIDTARSALAMAEVEERDQELRREGYMAASGQGQSSQEPKLIQNLKSNV